MATVSTATVGAGTAAATGNLNCGVLYSVTDKAGKAKEIDPATGSTKDAFELMSSDKDHNQLGIGPGGKYAIYTANNATIYKYDAASGKTSNGVKKPDGYAATHGAVNPADGLYYFGGASGSGFKFGVYDPATDKTTGTVITVNVDKKPGDNGDLAFDAKGNMYIVSASESKGVVYSVPGPMPKSGTPQLTGTAVTKVTEAFNASNSIAFGPNGFLYVGSRDHLYRVDPSTGERVAELTKSNMTDMGSCVDPNTIELHKTLPDGRVGKDDQFGLEITGGGLTAGNTATTSGDKSGLQEVLAGPVLALAGNTYTIKETAMNGADLSNYTVSWECVDAKTKEKTSGTGTTGTVAIPNGQSGKSVSCTFTNAAKKPGLELTKSVSPSDEDHFKVGQEVTYKFVMKNTGAVPLTGVTPVEKKFSGFGKEMSPFNCPDKDKTLNPGDTAECTATYTILQGDINLGAPIDNTAIATGKDPGGRPVESKESTATIKGRTATSGITLEKTAEPKSGVKVGDTVTYTFAIKNTGEQTLTDVKVNDEQFSGSGELSDIKCEDEAKSLDPGKSVSCTATYVFTDKDMNAGSVENTATATGIPPSKTPIESDPSKVTVTGDPESGLTLEKTAEPSENVKVGDTVTYNFAITNTGDQTLKDVTVKEGDFTGTGDLSDITCPDTSLDPGESVTCTATYTFTDEDVKAGQVDNVATATGTSPSDKPVDSNESDATVTAGEQPGGTGSLGTGSLGSLGAGSLAAGSLAAGSLAAGSLGAGSLDAGSLAAGSLGAGSLDAGSVDAGSLDAGSLGAGSLDAGSLDAGSLGAGSLDAGSLDAGSLAAGSLGAGSLAAGSLAAGSLADGSKENSGSAGSTGSGTPGGSNTPGGGTETGNPGTPGNPGNPGTPADSGNGGNGGKSGDQGTTGNSDTETGALIDSGLGADSEGGMNAGLVAGGLVLLVAAGGVLYFALRRRNQGSE
ncbi:DUF7507 domain-containing protein [Prescottella agglutinans]|uniref:DUF7507 domain-containing protein n=1 Tax=Prescottella agglutinans TaxID=1644129 RepID=UPI0013E2F7CF|nr:DUF11 domain-containing protein [Prescottella agglutinans]